MSSEEKVRINVFGSSHSDEIGVCIEGIRFGEKIDAEELQNFVNRRKPFGDFSTARRESDVLIFESGIENGVTTGGEIIIKMKNENARPKDYSELRYCPRPSHADYPAFMKYGEGYDASSGGKFSARMTAPMGAAGGVALQILRRKGISVGGYVQAIGGISGASYRNTTVDEQAVLTAGQSSFPLLDGRYEAAMMREIEGAKSSGDSVGGVIECCVFGVPAGSGEPLRGSIESEISRNVFAIPAVKGIEFGNGFALSAMRGSGANDEYYFDGNGRVKTSTNHNGGVLGGLATGMPITFRVAFKPAASISKEQKTVNLKTGEDTYITVKGRHDSCFVPRAVPVVESMAALAIINYV
ncbi:MAG: chorismate synthase [Clostridia bacterium]|nr:chorismate synthase [Clostridia bacterium]